MELIIIPVIILIILFVLIGILAQTSLVKFLALICALAVMAFLPMKSDTEVLWEYDFARFETHGIIEYVSPFDEDFTSCKITSIEIYNKMSRHEDILMKSYYSILGFKTMEVFTKNP